MRKTLLITLPALLALGGCSSVSRSFSRTDTNHDGKLSKTEFAEGVAHVAFPKYDTNKDRHVDLAEWQAVEGTSTERKQLFKKRDLNKDGKADFDEALNAARKSDRLAKYFDSVDTSKDGFIDKHEAAAYKKAHGKKSN